MITATTALFVRTLRLETRAFRGYGARLLLGGLVMLIMSGIVSTSFMRSAAGLDLIMIIVWCAFAFTTLAGLSHFCSAITEEKEEGTLGLMRMAGLDPLAILLAKSTARLWDSLLLAATLLPFATLAVTLGGVSLTQVFACAIALGAYVFMLANLGLLLSVVMRTSQGAGALMTMTLLAMLILPLFLEAMGMSGGWWRVAAAVGTAVDQASVVRRLIAILTTGFHDGAVGAQAWLDVLIGLVCFGIAWKVFDRFAHREAEIAPASVVVRMRGRLNVLRLPRPKSGMRAIVWKDFHFACGGRPAFVVKLALAAAFAGVGMWLCLRNSSPIEQAGNAYMTIGLSWLVIEAAALLAKIYAVEASGQTLDGLVGLPLDIRQIAYAKLLSLGPALLPAALLIALGAVLAPSAVLEALDEAIKHPLGTLTWIAMVLYFWHACAYLSLVVKRGALAAAIGLMIVTYVIFGMAVVLLGFLAHLDGTVMMAGVVVGLALACVFMHRGVARRLKRKAAGAV